MNKNLINNILEDQNLTQEQATEIINELEEAMRSEAVDNEEKKINNIDFELRNKLSEETDWRKKAALAARIISNGI